jgi:hypothetical protein
MLKTTGVSPARVAFLRKQTPVQIQVLTAGATLRFAASIDLLQQPNIGTQAPGLALVPANGNVSLFWGPGELWAVADAAGRQWNLEIPEGA